MKKLILVLIAGLVLITGCGEDTSSSKGKAKVKKYSRQYKVIHIFVALCDNKHQGIVPVPPNLGNGQNPTTNLYWGAMYGVKTFFKNSPHWVTLTSFTKPNRKDILNRCVFKSKGRGHSLYVVADAYDGACMKTTLLDFLHAAAGLKVTELKVSEGNNNVHLQAGGYSEMVCFIGHNGLMDTYLLSPFEFPENQGQVNPECAVILACCSHSSFVKPLRKANCKPLITTSDRMAPEAYTIDAVIRSWAAGDSFTATRRKAGAAYAKYQKISVKAGENLFIAGWGN